MSGYVNIHLHTLNAQGCKMRSAAISVRVGPEFKRALEASARREGRTLASYVERVLAIHESPPIWILRDAHPTNREETGPRVSLQIAEGWPAVSITADHAESLGRQLIEAAKIAKSLPAAE
jgi:hypothetical protein